MLMSHSLCSANYLFESFDAFMYRSGQTNHCIRVTATQTQTCITAAQRKQTKSSFIKTHSLSQRVADEFTPAGFQEVFNILFPFKTKQNLYLRKPSNKPYQTDEIEFLPDFRSPRQTLGKTDPLRGRMRNGRRHDLIALQRERLRLQRVVIVVVFLFVLASVISFIWVLLVKRVQIVLLYKSLKKEELFYFSLKSTYNVYTV